MTPLINILLRTSFRPQAFARCYASIKEQTYKNTQIFVSFDNCKALDYIPSYITALPVERSTKPFGYNLYCNELKQLVTDGWFFFLDDDDTLAYPQCIEDLARYLTNPDEAIICQFLRNERPKPPADLLNSEIILKGQIGIPCIVLHHSKKNIAEFKAIEDGDYQFIKTVQSRMHVRFIHQVLVSAKRRSFGFNEV
jgi:hypothetical protein